MKTDVRDSLIRVKRDSIRQLKRAQSISRKKRAADAYGVEILVVLDATVYRDFAARYSGESTIKLRMREYFAHIVNGIDLRYGSIQESDYTIYVTISGFVIAKTNSDSPGTAGKANTQANSVLSKFAKWRRNTKNLPTNDHAMLFTLSNLKSGTSSGVVGIAYLNGVCNNLGVSVNEDFGFFETTNVAAHELGHNLGSYHDGDKESSVAKQCNEESMYIMAPFVASVSEDSTTTKPWKFSSCSKIAFRNYIQKLDDDDDNCMENQGVIYDEDEWEQHTDNLPGQLYSLEEQCVLLAGESASVCNTNEGDSDICRSLGCKTSQGPCENYVPARGTSCGANKMCINGLCVVDPDDGGDSGGDDGGDSGGDNGGGDGECGRDVGTDEFNCAELREFYDETETFCRLWSEECCSYCSDGSGGGDSTESPDSRETEGTESPESRETDSTDSGSWEETDATQPWTEFETTSAIETTSAVKTTTEPPPEFVCANQGLLGGQVQCSQLKSVFGKSYCDMFGYECCQSCQKSCKKDAKIKINGKKMKCSYLEQELGFVAMCNHFTNTCCRTCMDSISR